MGLNKNFVHKNYLGNQIVQFVVETVPELPDEGTSMIQRANGSLLFVKNNTEQELYARINDEWFPWGGVSDYKVATSINDKFPGFLVAKLSGAGVDVTEDPSGDVFQTLITNSYTKVDSMDDVNPVDISENGVFVWDENNKKYAKATIGKGLMLTKTIVIVNEDEIITYDLTTFTALRNHVTEHTFNMLGSIPSATYVAKYIHSDINIDKAFHSIIASCKTGTCNVLIESIAWSTGDRNTLADFLILSGKPIQIEYDNAIPGGGYYPLNAFDRIDVTVSYSEGSVECKDLVITMGILTMSKH